MKDGFVCRACVRLLERYNVLKEKIMSSISKAVPLAEPPQQHDKYQLVHSSSRRNMSIK